MKSARMVMGVICGAACLTLFAGCETQRTACEREKRLTERLDEMQMEIDGQITNVNMEMAAFRANPPVVVQQAPAMLPPAPDYASAPVAAPAAMTVDTISIEDDFYSASKREQLEALAAASLRDQSSSGSSRSSATPSRAKNHIRVPVPVRTVQAALKEAGFYNGSVDGKVGNQTIAAITAFQRSVGLKADGICGRQTWQQLQGYAPAGMSTMRLK